MKSKRLTNIELCRIVSILLVLMVHSQYASLGRPEEVNSSTLLTMTLQAISIIGVNVFVFISGYFSIKPTVRSYVKLLFICFFYMSILCVATIVAGKFNYERLLFISRSNWFVVDYIGLMIIAPILNAFMDKCTKKQALIFITLFFIYQTWFDWGIETNEDFRNGYSMASFILLYIMARTMKKFDLSMKIRTSVFIFLMCTAVTVLIECASLTTQSDWKGAYDYNNPFVIISAVAFFNIFLRLKVPYNKAINYMAQSTLSILLIHMMPVIFATYWAYCSYLNEMAWYYYLPSLLLSIIAIALACTAIDQVRIFVYNTLVKLYDSRKKIK